MRIVYVPLEAYEERYTLQLKQWTLAEFDHLKVQYIVIEGDSLDTSGQIKTGVVLDAHQRSYFALSQIQKLIAMHYNNSLTSNDFILFEDMFHPGIEALAYAFDLANYQQGKVKPYIGVKCLAQTVDPDDFVHYAGLSYWMRKYEQMVCKFVDVVFMNSEEMLPFMTAAGWEVPVAVTGNAFSRKEVVARLGTKIKPFDLRKHRVLFTSRIADEKQFAFFLAIAKYFYKNVGYDPIDFTILSGGRISHSLIDQAVIQYGLTVYPNLSKQVYYKILNDSKVVFNCSLQDWASITIPEADALGCNVIAPAYRSFPEVFFNDADRLYVPWSLPDAISKVSRALDAPSINQGKISAYQDKSIKRTVDIIKTIMLKSVTLLSPTNTEYRKDIVKKALGDIA